MIECVRFVAVALIVAWTANSAACSRGSTQPTEWDYLSVSGRDLHILVWTGSSSCNNLDQVVVDETDDVVNVSATLRVSGDNGCTADLNSEEVTVELESPLGRRELRGCRPPDPEVRSDGKGRDPGPNCGADQT
jgi:hypothetical protein